MADKKPADKKPKTIVDVAQPGTSAPATSGKSVIVTNRPILKDPMMADEANTESTAAQVKIKSKASPQTASLEETVGIDQATAPELPSIEVKANGTVESAEPKAEPKKPEIKPPSDEKEKPDEKLAAKTEKQSAKTEPAADDTAETDEADEAPAPVPDEAKQEALAAAQAEHDANVQKLIDSKQFFLSINSREKRKTKHFVILGIVLSIFLALAWADIALDANLIHISGVKPVTHFFSN